MDDHKNVQGAAVSRIQVSGRLVDQAYAILRQAIIARKFKPGERLRQKDLAGELGVSQMIIREVLARLEADGLVIRRPYKGTTAAPHSLQEIEELYHMRLILEGYALELAADRITEAEMVQMRELLPLTTYYIDRPCDLSEVLQKHREFHAVAIRASRNRYLIRTLNQIWDLIDPLLRYSPELRPVQKPDELIESSQNDLRYHLELVDALAARDGKKARAVNDFHLMDGFESLRDPLQTMIQKNDSPSPEQI